MSTIILDFGSGNTGRNEPYTMTAMVNELMKVDSRRHGHRIIIKWQLFEKAGDNIPLDRQQFHVFYEYALEMGYESTASVFDLPSLQFLLSVAKDKCGKQAATFEESKEPIQPQDMVSGLPFIKIANRRDLDYLIGYIPRRIPVYVSVGAASLPVLPYNENIKELFCVSKYPADISDYEPYMHRLKGISGISDHTDTFELWHTYQPEIIEWHYKLPNSTGLDAGSFARTPEQLREIIG